MKFLDYEKLIRDKHPILIESYVKQYGEEYRDHIVNVLNNVRYCIYETPLTISKYVNQKVNQDFMKAILDSYVEMGLDISSVSLDIDEFVFKDEKMCCLTEIFFPERDSMDKIKHSGIFTFSKEFDNLDIKDPIFKRRIKVLEKLNLKDKSINTKDYINSSEYVENCKLLRSVLKIVSNNIDKRCSDNYLEFVEYADSLEKKINDIARLYEREYLLNVSEFLCLDDREKLKDKEFNIKELNDYYLFFDENNPDDNYCFSEGALEYFSLLYTEDLVSKRVSKYDKEIIINMRLKYLRKKGFDITSLNKEELFCDWYSLDYLKEFLPNKKIVEELTRKIYTRNKKFLTMTTSIINRCCF